MQSKPTSPSNLSRQTGQRAGASADTPPSSQGHTMYFAHLPNPLYPENVPDFPHVPNEFEPGSPPLEPDEGPFPVTAPGEARPAVHPVGLAL